MSTQLLAGANDLDRHDRIDPEAVADGTLGFASSSIAGPSRD